MSKRAHYTFGLPHVNHPVTRVKGYTDNSQYDNLITEYLKHNYNCTCLLS